MFHSVYVWLYKRKDRSNSFVVPRDLHKRNQSVLHLTDFLVRTGVQGKRGLRHYDQVRRRRRFAQIVTTVVLLSLILWVSYESFVALATMGD